MCLLACFLVVQYFSTVIVSKDVNILYVRKDKGIRVLELWNISNVYCGKFDNEHAYRNDYIDYVALDCIEALTVRIFQNDNKQLTLTYRSINSKNLESILSRKPDSAISPKLHDKRRVPLSTDQYRVNKGNYEFMWTNEEGVKIYAAMYYNSESSSTPKFYYSERDNGDTYDNPGDAEKPSGMRSVHKVRISITVKDEYRCNEDDFDHSNHMNKCPDFKPPTVTSTKTTYTEEIGSNVTLKCQHAANNDPVTKVEWLFQNIIGNSYGVQIVINTNVAKYGGSTVASPSLIIYNIMPDNIGEYKCQAFTDYASKPGSGPPIVVGLQGGIYSN
ncbi:uncharacterized protein LOC127724282 [Mytilus californianus]|uniref:uncharacterized protein LOC127724282 n=1 Tax=Mytilus californianus TaxID=6549 RepID=UPI002246D7BC|nr:uncharacterized protein LOC127724282 [Mytilus californianus]